MSSNMFKTNSNLFTLKFKHSYNLIMVTYRANIYNSIRVLWLRVLNVYHFNIYLYVFAFTALATLYKVSVKHRVCVKEKQTLILYIDSTKYYFSFNILQSKFMAFFFDNYQNTFANWYSWNIEYIST